MPKWSGPLQQYSTWEYTATFVTRNGLTSGSGKNTYPMDCTEVRNGVRTPIMPRSSLYIAQNAPFTIMTRVHTGYILVSIRHCQIRRAFASMTTGNFLHLPPCIVPGLSRLRSLQSPQLCPQTYIPGYRLSRQYAEPAMRNWWASPRS